MASEFRRILFTHAEIKQALEQSGRDSVVNLPAGDVTGVKSSREDNEFFFEFEFFDFTKQKSDMLTVPTAEIREVLIEFCISSSIALPRAAEKSVRELETRLSLEMSLN